MCRGCTATTTAGRISPHGVRPRLLERNPRQPQQRRARELEAAGHSPPPNTPSVVQFCYTASPSLTSARHFLLEEFQDRNLVTPQCGGRLLAAGAAGPRGGGKPPGGAQEGGVHPRRGRGVLPPPRARRNRA